MVFLYIRYVCSLRRGQRVCIIGRGHAVQGLTVMWHNMGLHDKYNLDQCSSTALDMGYRVSRADIIVNSADAVTEEVLGAVPAQSTVIDISGSMEPQPGASAGCGQLFDVSIFLPVAWGLFPGHG